MEYGSWTRDYEYDEASVIEPGMVNNRLSHTVVGSVTEPYAYDAHGSMTAMLHLSVMRWDYLDRLAAIARQAVNGGTPETTYYAYDAGGQRVRKVTERQAAPDETATRLKERIYLAASRSTASTTAWALRWRSSARRCTSWTASSG